MSKGFACSWKRTLTADIVTEPKMRGRAFRAKKLVGFMCTKLFVLYA